MIFGYTLSHTKMKSTSQPLVRLIQDMSSGDIVKTEKRMKKYSCSMLDQGNSLVECIEKDESALEKLDLKYEDFADWIDLIVGLVMQHRQYILEETGEDPCERGVARITINGRIFAVLCNAVGDAESCPFRRGKYEEGSYHDCGLGPRGVYEFVVKNVETGSQFEFTSLTSHLIRDHHFFLGDVMDRVTPEWMSKVLGLDTMKAPTVRKIEENYWHLNSQIPKVDDDFLKDIEKFSSCKGVWMKKCGGKLLALPYFIQDCKDLVKEFQEKAELDIKEETDKVVIDCLRTDMKAQIETIKQRPDQERLILICKDDPPTQNSLLIKNRLLRVSDWNDEMYHFTLAKRRILDHKGYNLGGIEYVA